MNHLETKTETLQKKFDNLELTQSVLAEQLMTISRLQSDIAKQVLKQNEQTEYLYQVLGLKKDLSHYSYDIMNQEEH